jgi:hypothetical protein
MVRVKKLQTRREEKKISSEERRVDTQSWDNSQTKPSQQLIDSFNHLPISCLPIV